MKKYLQKFKALGIFLGVILVSSVIANIYVWFHTQERLSVDLMRQNMAQYGFISTAEDVMITETSNEFTADWQDQEGHFYISAFDTAVSEAPDTALNEYAKIPSGCRKLQVDAVIAGTRNDTESESYDLSFTVITYCNDKVENSVTEEIVLNSNFEGRGRMHSLSVPVTNEATSYRVLFRVGIPSEKSSSGYLKVSRFYVDFQ